MKTEGFALRGEFLGPFPGGPVCRPYGMVWGGASGRPRPTWDGISGTGGSGTRPYGESGNGPFFFVGAGHWPARRRASAIPEPNLIRLAYARHLLPGREKAFGRLIAAPTADTEAVSSSRRGRSQTGPRAATWGRPYGSQKFFRDSPWASRRQRTWYRLLGKPRRRNRAAEPEIFAHPGPSGPGDEAESHSNFARRNYCRT